MRMDGIQGGYMLNNEHEWSAIRINIRMDALQGECMVNRRDGGQP